VDTRVRRRLGAAVLALALPVTTASACGFCVEDKLAAVYDHAQVTRALGARHHVAFCGIEGAVAARDGQRAAIARALEAIAGVDRGSVRVSLEHATVSFAFDPARAPLPTVLRAARRKLSDRGLTLVPLRVMERAARLQGPE
jgi:hypothetical protein